MVIDWLRSRREGAQLEMDEDVSCVADALSGKPVPPGRNESHDGNVTEKNVSLLVTFAVW